MNIFVGFVIVTFQEQGEQEYKNCELDKNQVCLLCIITLWYGSQSVLVPTTNNFSFYKRGPKLQMKDDQYFNFESSQYAGYYLKTLWTEQSSSRRDIWKEKNKDCITTQ